MKYKDFVIISNLSQFFYVFILLYRVELMVQRGGATCLLFSNVLCSCVALFRGSGGSCWLLSVYGHSHFGVGVWGSGRGGGPARWATIMWGLDVFLICPNFLRS